jgi:hypothetical protein
MQGKDSAGLEEFGGVFGEVGDDEVRAGAADGGLDGSRDFLHSTPQGF